MINSKNFVALGLMSGTSADAIDVGLIETDGKDKIILKSSLTYPFTKEFSRKIKKIFITELNEKSLKSKKIMEIEREFTDLNYMAVKKFLKKYKINKNNIDIVGFHGQTISHNPRQGYSHQLGDSKRLANLLKINVVANFRDNDVTHGGEGAPLTPIFHYYLTHKINKKICFINLGGISNVTWINYKNKKNLQDILAYDAGPCCSLIDDWVNFKTNNRYDKLGNYAKKGNSNKKIVNSYLKNNFFLKLPPKSLDRNFFSISNIKGELNLYDGAATFCDLSVQCLSKSFVFLPSKPDICILSGGGRHNTYLVDEIKKEIKSIVKSSDEYNWDGDILEAYAFAFLSVRKLLNLPISFPNTTNIKKPLVGGKIFNF